MTDTSRHPVSESALNLCHKPLLSRAWPRTDQDRGIPLSDSFSLDIAAGATRKSVPNPEYGRRGRPAKDRCQTGFISPRKMRPLGHFTLQNLMQVQKISINPNRSMPSIYKYLNTRSALSIAKSSSLPSHKAADTQHNCITHLTYQSPSHHVPPQTIEAHDPCPVRQASNIGSGHRPPKTICQPK